MVPRSSYAAPRATCQRVNASSMSTSLVPTCVTYGSTYQLVRAITNCGVPNRPIFLYADETNYTLIDRFGPDFWRLKSGQGSHWMSRTSFEEEESCGSLDTCTNSKRQQTVRTIRMHSSPANSTQSQYYHLLTLLTCRTIELSSPVGFLCLPRVA